MQLSKNSKSFLDFIETWLNTLPMLSFEEAVPEPERSAIISTDVINAFLYEGSLSSSRVAEIDKPITDLRSAIRANHCTNEVEAVLKF